MKDSQSFLQTLKKVIQKNPSMTKDMAVLLSSIQFNELAIKLIEDQLSHSSVQWLYLELLLKCKKYLRLLDYIDQIKSKGQEETFPYLLYIQAQAYYGLKEFDQADTLLKDFIHQNPKHQAAQTLLSKWNRKGLSR